MFGLIGILWSFATLPSFWLVTPARNMSERILMDDRPKPGALSDILVRIEQQPHPVLLQPELGQAEALIRLRAAEEAIEQKPTDEADRAVAIAANKLRFGLSMNPANGFLWLMLYSVATVSSGFDPSNIRHLGQSYVTAPLDGWIALRRNRLGLAVFPMLSGAMQENAVSEFASLVDSGFIDDAAISLTSTGWAQRERLLVSLERVDIVQRVAFVKRLLRDGVKAAVPGVEIDERPWRR
ncbi:hypothetical protein [Bradyrhizobium neotropicale]|uniref:hypothetical protein n=1 Tax=Bradyrhizobium neotropicale TaxID=1497615 RepID=UPI001AD6B402|nr:hypothetical protein [Bradyrhizobium neotropicale]MBO4227980.1 hypothetical protein [Bradyrhizobium neotropicale]